MHLILSGGGAGTQVSKSYEKYAEIIDKNKPVLYIPLAWKNQDYESCITWLKGELKPYGIFNIEMITDPIEFKDIDLSKYSSIFIGGGNTYKLLNYLKESKGYEKIEEFIKNNGIVFGGSAGAIIFGKNIQSCNICSSDENLWPNLDLTGFDVLNGKSISCHYANKDNQEKHDKITEEYINKGFDIINITEEQSIYISENTTYIINN